MMTSKRVLAALALAALPAASAFAADQTINLTAEVPKFCKFDGVPTFGSLGNVTVGSVSTSSSVVNVTTATNATGIMNAASFNFTIPATCNFPSQVTFVSANGGLKDTSPEPVVSGSFLSRIDYVASMFAWNGAAPFSLSTNGSPNASASSTGNAPHSGNLQGLVVLTVNTSAPLAAGDYTDTLRISLTPQ